MENKLKPCPFCGGEAEVITVRLSSCELLDGYISFGTYIVQCMECECKTREFKTTERTKLDSKGNFLEFISSFDGQKDAIAFWNKRKNKAKKISHPPQSSHF